MTEKETERAIGKIDSVSVKENPDKNGKWDRRASITLDMGNGKKMIVSTFNEDDIDFANSKNGKMVRVAYKNKKSGNTVYHNLLKGGIEEYEETAAPDVKEEKVESNPKLPETGTNKFDSDGNDLSKKSNKEQKVALIETSDKQTFVKQINKLNMSKNVFATTYRPVVKGDKLIYTAIVFFKED